MTQADSAQALRMSLDSGPSGGQGQASVRDPLPAGWAGFCSRPDPEGQPCHWYAAAPYLAYLIEGQRPGKVLMQTVWATSWGALHRAVAEQLAIYRELTGAAT